MIRLRNVFKRTVAITMSVLLTASMMPEAVYGDYGDGEELWVIVEDERVKVADDYEGPYKPSDNPVDRSSDDFSFVDVDNGYDSGGSGDVTVKVGNIEGDDGLDVWLGSEGGENMAKTTVETGNITTSEGSDDGVYVYAEGSPESEAEISTGVINATNGVIIESIGPKVTVNNKGGINATENGLVVLSGDGKKTGGKVKVSVDGTISAGKGIYTVEEEYDGSEVEEVGIPVSGIMIGNYLGDVSVDVKGNVTGSYGMFLDSEGKTQITVNGDVTGTGCEDEDQTVIGVGIYAQYADNLDVLVNGTIKGDPEKGVGVMTNSAGYDLDDTEGKFKLTVWKIEPTAADSPGPGVVAATYRYDDEKPDEENEDFEKSIQYIVKIDPTAVAGVTGLRAAKSDGSSLDKEGDYEIAKEGDTIFIKVELQDGYEIAAAYGKENQQYPFAKDESGNYYIVMPRGGGIFISVKTQKKAVVPVDPDIPDDPVDQLVIVKEVNPDMADNTESSPGSTVRMDPFTEFNNSNIQTIINAAPGANVQIITTVWKSVNKELLDALVARPDVSITIIYLRDGVLYSITIPAGADINSLRNESGGADFTVLASVFGETPIGNIN